MTSRRLRGPVGALSGRAEVPTSKSLTNRALIAAAAAAGGTIARPLDCEDTRRLADALAAAGWPVEWRREIEIGPRRRIDRAEVDLGNSGTGARLVLGLLACVPGRFRVDGTARLRERPMEPLLDALTELGSELVSRGGSLPVEVMGRRLPGGRVRIRPEVSSQFVSSLLLAAPLMERGLEIEVAGPIPSRPYLQLTREVLEAYGAGISVDDGGRWRVAPDRLRRIRYVVEGDWSAAAFAAAAVAVAGGGLTVGPLSGSSSQGDRALCSILERAGVELEMSGEDLLVRGRMTRPFEADLTDTPDLFPALVVVAATGPAGSVLRGLDHLKHKESDRLAVMVDNLGRLGAGFERGPSSLRIVRAVERRPGAVPGVTAADDHRIAMAMAVAALRVGELELDDDRCVAKSFPRFWRVWESIVEGAARS